MSSTKIDLSAIPATPAVDEKTRLLETDDVHVTRCKSTTSSANRRCPGADTVLIVFCVLACALAFSSVKNNYKLFERLQHLENRYAELAVRSQQQQQQQRQQSSSAAEQKSEPSKTGIDAGTAESKTDAHAQPIGTSEASGPHQSKPELVVENELLEDDLDLGSGIGTVDIDSDDVYLLSDVESSGEVDWLNDEFLSEQPRPLLEFQDELAPLDAHAQDRGVKSRSRRSAAAAAAAVPAVDRRPAETSGGAVEDDTPVGDLAVGDDPAAAGAGDQRSRQLQQSSNRRHGSGRQLDRTASGHSQRHRPNDNLQQLTTNAQIKVAQFVASRQESHYVTDNTPPVTYRFWQPDNMTLSLRPSFFSHNPNTGTVTILESGVYMIYAQIVYHDLSGRWAFGVYVDDAERFKCINTEQLHSQPQLRSGQSSNSHSVYQSCYTSGLLRLQTYSQLSLRCLYGGKSVVMQPGFTYWGIVKLISL